MRDVTSLYAGLEELREACEERKRLNPHLLLRSTYVGYRGPLTSPILLLGESPGDMDEMQGRPFAGMSGELLKTLLLEVGVPEDGVLFGYVLKFRPASSRKCLTEPQEKNRKPNKGELDAFADITAKEIALLSPKVIVALGGTALSWCVGEELKITHNQGGIFIRPPDTPVVATFHPSYLIHRRQEHAGRDRDKVVQDIRTALKLLRE